MEGGNPRLEPDEPTDQGGRVRPGDPHVPEARDRCRLRGAGQLQRPVPQATHPAAAGGSTSGPGGEPRGRGAARREDGRPLASGVPSRYARKRDVRTLRGISTAATTSGTATTCGDSSRPGKLGACRVRNPEDALDHKISVDIVSTACSCSAPATAVRRRRWTTTARTPAPPRSAGALEARVQVRQAQRRIDGIFIGAPAEKILLAEQRTDPGHFTIREWPIRRWRQNLLPFVITRGGEYCFARVSARLRG